MHKIKNALKLLICSPKNFIYAFLLKIFRTKGICKIIPSALHVKIEYELHFQKKLDLKSPKTFNEKLQWLKLNNRNSLYTTLVDKYNVREYIAQKIGREYLIPLIGVYDSFEEIKFDQLPNQFVLKCTHDSGGIIICKDKSKFNIDFARKKINKCLKKNFFYHGREWPYKNVTPRVICEKYMTDESGIELKDFKIFCFNGEPKLIQVDFNRHVAHKKNIYDTQWNLLDLSYNYPNDINYSIQKPKMFYKMLALARILSEGIPFIRVDLYSIEEKIYFGELTFFPANGVGKFNPAIYDEILGSWIQLPKNKLYF